MRRAKAQTERSIDLPKQQKPPAPPQFDWVCELSKQFQEEIEKRLQIREAIFKRGEPQKCLAHNISYSIYCTICRKALCASCMYNTLQHRKHRVIPIHTATEQLKEDIKTFQSKIMKIGNQAESLIESNGEVLMRIEKQYNPLVTKMKDFYQSLRIFIKKKEKQHLERLKLIKEQTIAQISHYNRELARMNEVIMCKMKQCITEDYKFIQPLAPRSILETLLQSSKFINQALLDGEKFKLPTDVDKVSALQAQIEMKIDTLFSTFQASMRSPRTCQIQKFKQKYTGKKVSFTQTKFKLLQNQTSDKKNKNRSMSNIAGRSQLHRI